METFHFLRPAWFFAALLAPVIVFVWRRLAQRKTRWESVIDPSFLDLLLEEGRAANRIIPALAGLGFLIGVTAAAGPTWQERPQAVEQRLDGLVILLDLSLSMYVEDVDPSRLVRAKHKVEDILKQREEGFTGLIVYAGDGHLVTPLTDDTNTIVNLLKGLDPSIMPVQGSRPGQALEIAHQLFDNAGFESGQILVVTDGIGPTDEVTRFVDASFPISFIGVGTAAGGPIPMQLLNQPGQYLTLDDGTRIEPRLDAERLAGIAAIAHGRYHTLTVDDADLDEVLFEPPVAALDTEEREFDTWFDMGFLLIPILLAMTLLAFRRGVVVAVALCALLIAHDRVRPVHAAEDGRIRVPAAEGYVSTWDRLWARPDQHAYDALKSGQPEFAALWFEDPDWQAVARYRSDDFATAVALFQQDPSVRGWFNLGNALAHSGELEAAIGAYDRALGIEPIHEDAAHNRALVDELLRAQAEEGGNPNQSMDRRREGDESQERQDSDQESGASDSQNDQDAESGEGEQQSEELKQAELEYRDEALDSLDQWLRRIPDDPAGLLERKFQHETKRRLRSGDYRYRQTERIW